jgi:hypothetical protein
MIEVSPRVSNRARRFVDVAAVAVAELEIGY